MSVSYGGGDSKHVVPPFGNSVGSDAVADKPGGRPVWLRVGHSPETLIAEIFDSWREAGAAQIEEPEDEVNDLVETAESAWESVTESWWDNGRSSAKAISDRPQKPGSGSSMDPADRKWLH